MDIQALFKKAFDEKGLSEEQQEQVLAMVGETMHKRILLATAEYIKEEDKEAFAKLLKNKDEDPFAVYAFANAHVENYEQLMADEVRDAVDGYLFAVSL